MSRSKWKGIFLDNLIYSSLVCKKKTPNSFSRRTRLIKDFENITSWVYNGKKKNSFRITDQMLGFSLGNFVLTRKVRAYVGKNQK